ncbi:MAG: hypothetical protein CMB99_07470 [Flavobacteriaceae bacterium]|nr:hypothetical protein [Flavobacteriaceae bacterium]|tara:strand:+ start:106040 stop:106804 length:765 start_codon:yes stop_codon:yes gene_type:complete
MIKFFRKIRKKLLTENKLSRYLLYASGEIILVVIGILFALQINNWNEEHKNAKKELYTLKELRKEFKNDSVKLKSFSFLTEGKTKDGRMLKEVYLNKRTMPPDSIILRVFFNGRVVLFESYTPTYDELLSTGKLDLIKNEELKKLINSYKSNLEIEKTFFSYEAQKRKEAYNNHLFKYFEPQIMSALWERERGEEILGYAHDIKGFFKDPETLLQINTMIGVDRELNWKYSQRTMWRIVSIIESINKEIVRKSN